jgi:hypothetical protein
MVSAPYKVEALYKGTSQIDFSKTVSAPVTVNTKIISDDTSMIFTNPHLRDFKNDIKIKFQSLSKCSKANTPTEF